MYEPRGQVRGVTREDAVTQLKAQGWSAISEVVLVPASEFVALTLEGEGSRHYSPECAIDDPRSRE